MVSIPIWLLVVLLVLSFIAIASVLLMFASFWVFAWESKNVKYRGLYDTQQESKDCECHCKPR